MEGACGRGLWKGAVEGDCGRGLWKGTVEGNVEGGCGTRWLWHRAATTWGDLVSADDELPRREDDARAAVPVNERGEARSVCE